VEFWIFTPLVLITELAVICLWMGRRTGRHRK
jgi:hypothetical protein